MKGKTIDECISLAEQYIERYGRCLLIFDVKNSRMHPDRTALQKELEAYIQEMNTTYESCMPFNRLRNHIDYDSGFVLIGDSACAGINDPYFIQDIISSWKKEEHKGFGLYWSVAKDGFDEEARRMFS